MMQIKSNSKVIVTGADGFLGSNIVRELLARGHEVLGFIQHGRSADTLKGFPVKLFYGDICKIEDLVPLFRDCDYIIHTAGLTSLWPKKSSSSWNVNYHAVKNLVMLARKYEIKRFIHIGTANSFGPGPLSNPGNENTPYTSGQYGVDYFDSKYKAQKYLIHQATTTNFPVIILNPTFMIGPYDSEFGSNKMILEIYNKNVPGYSKGGKNYVHVRDVATAAVNALSLGRLGECYIVGNQNLSYKVAFRMIADTLKVRPPKLPLPSYLTIAFGAYNLVLSKLIGKYPIVTVQMARVACADCYYSPEKAIEELKLPQTPIELAVSESYDWFKGRGSVT